MNRAGDVELDLANALWPQAGYPILDDFLTRSRQDYGIAITSLDDQHNEAASRAQINRWVADRSRGRITNRIASPFDAVTRLVLVNAVSFKGAWDSKFDPSRTQDAAFCSGTDPVGRLALMAQTGFFRYAESADSEVIALPHKGGGLSMVVVLPQDRTPAGLAQLEQTPSSAAISSLKGAVETGQR